ncbi:MAG: twin-arginine translocase TatA/TatE family subunit [Elusimicrobia bacterium]|nr:twin-arginine translocase TatA/TatE family subunit [Elusimicrobiota bacterium]
MLPNIGYGELVIILVLALILFGAKRIPEVARSLGRAVNAFKSGLRDTTEIPPESDKENKPKE